MKKNLKIKIYVDEPTLSYEKHTQWERLEKLAGKCPVPHFSTGYCLQKIDSPKSYRDYCYSNLSEEQLDMVRVYWQSSEIETDIEIWDSEVDWPILNSDLIKIENDR